MNSTSSSFDELCLCSHLAPSPFLQLRLPGRGLFLRGGRLQRRRAERLGAGERAHACVYAQRVRKWSFCMTPDVHVGVAMLRCLLRQWSPSTIHTRSPGAPGFWLPPDRYTGTASPPAPRPVPAPLPPPPAPRKCSSRWSAPRRPAPSPGIWPPLHPSRAAPAAAPGPCCWAASAAAARTQSHRWVGML